MPPRTPRPGDPPALNDPTPPNDDAAATVSGDGTGTALPPVADVEQTAAADEDPQAIPAAWDPDDVDFAGRPAAGDVSTQIAEQLGHTTSEED